MMIAFEHLSDEEFERRALAILERELGLDGLGRFLRVYRSGTNDYTRDRHQWLQDVTIEEVMAEVRRQRQPQDGGCGTPPEIHGSREI